MVAYGSRNARNTLQKISPYRCGEWCMCIVHLLNRWWRLWIGAEWAHWPETGCSPCQRAGGGAAAEKEKDTGRSIPMSNMWLHKGGTNFNVWGERSWCNETSGDQEVLCMRQMWSADIDLECPDSYRTVPEMRVNGSRTLFNVQTKEGSSNPWKVLRNRRPSNKFIAIRLNMRNHRVSLKCGFLVCRLQLWCWD